jgi:hypothetical protein
MASLSAVEDRDSSSDARNTEVQASALSNPEQRTSNLGFSTNSESLISNPGHILSPPA